MIGDWAQPVLSEIYMLYSYLAAAKDKWTMLRESVYEPYAVGRHSNKKLKISSKPLWGF